jgi:hypothetical protein
MVGGLVDLCILKKLYSSLLPTVLSIFVHLRATMSLSNSTPLRGLSPTPPSTPISLDFSPTTLEEQDVIAAYVNGVLGCYSTISSFPDLQPSPQVNDAFEKLVAFCIQVKDESIVKNVRLLSTSGRQEEYRKRVKSDSYSRYWQIAKSAT